MTNLNYHEGGFLGFLEAMGSGQCSAEEWQRFVVVHYDNPRYESARVTLVRTSVELNSWKWPDVPAQLQSTAQHLYASLV